MNTAHDIMHRFGAIALRVVFVVLLATLGVLIAGAVSAQPLVDATSALERADARVEQETERFERQRAAYERELAAVDALRGGGVLNAFSEASLRDALRRANSAADLLIIADTERLAAVQEREHAAAVLANVIQAEIDEIESNLLHLVDASALAAAVERLNDLSSRRAALAQRQTGDAIDVPLSEILADLPETAEEMLAAADELTDHLTRLEAELEYWSAEADRYERWQRIQGRAIEGRLQDDLFGDGTARPTARAAGAATAEDDGAVEDAAPRGDQENVAEPGTSGALDGPTVDVSEGDEAGSRDPDSDFAMSPETDDLGSGGAEMPETAAPPTVTIGGRELIFDDGGRGASIVDLRDSADPTVREVDGLVNDGLMRDPAWGSTSPRQRRDAIAAEVEALRAERQRLLRSASALQE